MSRGRFLWMGVLSSQFPRPSIGVCLCTTLWQMLETRFRFGEEGVEMVVAGNRSERGGALNQITLCHGDQFIPGMRAQFFDNVITEGINLGASYVFPRGSLIGTYTYTPLYFERVIQKNNGQPVTAPDYHGPLAVDQIFRRNRIESAGNF